MTLPSPFRYFIFALLTFAFTACTPSSEPDSSSTRERILINEDWRFFKYESADQADTLVYDIRPAFEDDEDGKEADAMPTEAVDLADAKNVLKPWILPSANAFIAKEEDRYPVPSGRPTADLPLLHASFDDSQWQSVELPHDWAIEGPFYEGENPPVGGGMGRLPSPGVAWYRKSLEFSAQDLERALYLDIDGAMSYAMVWLNGELVGGWPYGYNSFRLDLSPYAKAGNNTLAIRIDNPAASSRWYPGGGLYRNVWLVKASKIHLSHWGTFITTPKVSAESAKVLVQQDVENNSATEASITLHSEIFEVNESGEIIGEAVAQLTDKTFRLEAGAKERNYFTADINAPKLWGPLPTQKPNRYALVSKVKNGDRVIDEQTIKFGIRSLEFDAETGVSVNGEKIYMQGVNQHHDLGALGAAFNVRAAERQLEILREMGVNSIRLAHNPPDPQLLELTDRMGFLVVNEIFDVWERKKTPHDFHLIYEDWSEADMRAFIRRDRNNPSVIMWSLGNEVGEQYTGEEGLEVGLRLHRIAKEEDPTRPTAASQNYAKAHMPFTSMMDTISLNYQGEGIRNAPAYAHMQGIRTEPSYPSFKEAYPEKLIFSSENAAAVSSRGEYIFPVFDGISAPVEGSQGGDGQHVSAYELYTTPFGSSADKVLASLAKHPYVAGGFAWSGWDYIGEPTPYYSARSSYFGSIDLAGFKKDRFYLYQAAWRPDFPMAHILPHWNWPGREGEITPIHIFTSGDEAEVFLNGESLGRKKKGEYEYRLRWDDVKYSPGTVEVVAYKNGEEWARSSVSTTGEAAALRASVDRANINADGVDLAFVRVEVIDADGNIVPDADPLLNFSIEGAGKLVATDNGDPTDMRAFPLHDRNAFNGLALGIVKSKKSQPGAITVNIQSDGLQGTSLSVNSQ